MPRAVAVAASGGRDSTALLHATARAARDLGVEVHALHVHHGLVPEADQWLVRLRRQCARWTSAGWPVHFHATRLAGAPARGDSVEAWARRERYAALSQMARARDCDLVLLAHHRRDQAETWLLQALRGAGPAGLAAMPAVADRASVTFARPWLHHPREAIEAYVRRHRLRFSDDASNADPRYARNRLRASVWPALSAAFPDAESSLAAAAARAAEASACLAELASTDAAACIADGRLQVAAWLDLSAARRRLLLRHWLKLATGDAPDSLVDRLAAELPRTRATRWPAPAGECRLHRGRVEFVSAPTRSPPGARAIDLSQPARHPLPEWGGTLVVRACTRGGIACERLRRAVLDGRQGGESFQFEPRSAARSLKKQYQARGVPAWQRRGPLVYDGDVLLFVPMLGADARALAGDGVPQCSLSWEPDAAG